MRVGRDEALDLLRKWRSESTLLQCDFRFPLFAACFRGKVFRVSDDEVGVISEDKTSELVLRLDPSLTFGYGDSRGREDAATFVGGLVAFFELGEAGEESDFISFTELA